MSGLGALLALATCDDGPPTVIDGSSPERFEQSVKRARRDIPDADRLVFDRAMRTIGGRRHSADPGTLARVTFDGMTGADVVADQRMRD